MPSSKLTKYRMQSDKCIRTIHDNIGIPHIIYFGSRSHIIFQNTMKQMCRMIKNVFGKLNSRKMDRSFTNILSQETAFLSFLVNSQYVMELFTWIMCLLYLLTLLRCENKSIFSIHSQMTEFGQTEKS